jgi:DNA-binding transcriptional MocR family regulator
MAPPSEAGLSSRGVAYESHAAIRTLLATIWETAYDRDSNPGGTIDIGTAENYNMNGRVAAFIKEHVHISGSHLCYGSGPWGSLRLRKAMAKYLQKYFNPREAIDPEHLLFSSGCTSLCEMLGFSLFEPGDVLLLSRPCYQAFQSDFGSRAGSVPKILRQGLINTA